MATAEVVVPYDSSNGWDRKPRRPRNRDPVDAEWRRYDRAMKALRRDLTRRTLGSDDTLIEDLTGQRAAKGLV